MKKSARRRLPVVLLLIVLALYGYGKYHDRDLIKAVSDFAMGASSISEILSSDSSSITQIETEQTVEADSESAVQDETELPVEDGNVENIENNVLLGEVETEQTEDTGVTTAETAQILQKLLEATSSKEITCNIVAASRDILPLDSQILSLQSYIKGFQMSGLQYSNGTVSVTYTFEYMDGAKYVYALKTNDTSALDDREMQIYQVIKYVLDNYTSPSNSDYENELAIHDYLVQNVQYDYSTTVPSDSFDIYGALINKTAVCQGYAWAFMVFMDALGINNQLVSGDVSGVGHLWNMVNLDGEWYQVDVTWDDPEQNGDQSIPHYYFNVTDSMISYQHTYEAAQYPSANATTYNYYQYNGLYATTEDELQMILEREMENQVPVITIACINGVVLDEQPYLWKYCTEYGFKSLTLGDTVFYTITPEYR